MVLDLGEKTVQCCGHALAESHFLMMHYDDIVLFVCFSAWYFFMAIQLQLLAFAAGVDPKG